MFYVGLSGSSIAFFTGLMLLMQRFAMGWVPLGTGIGMIVLLAMQNRKRKTRRSVGDNIGRYRFDCSDAILCGDCVTERCD